LFKLPPKDIAERLVPALGGRDKVIALAKEARRGVSEGSLQSTKQLRPCQTVHFFRTR